MKKPGILLLPLMMLLFTIGIGHVPLAAAVPQGKYFDHIVIILMENKPLTAVYNIVPFQTQLGNKNALALNYTGCDHPSEPNYMCLLFAQDLNSGTDADPSPSTMTNDTAIVERMGDLGLTWKAMAEGYPGGCHLASTSTFAAKHFPFVFSIPITTNPAKCANLIPGDPPTLLNFLANPATAPNYLWLTPNECNDAHSCPVQTGDNYLASFVPQVLSSPTFLQTRSVLFITYDEDGTPLVDPLYAIFAGSAAKKGFTTHSFYSHFSLPKTIEDNWNLPSLGGRDVGAKSMNGMFPGLLGDIDGDGIVDQVDLGLVGSAFLTCVGQPRFNPSVDLDHDDCVNFIELGIVGANYGHAL